MFSSLKVNRILKGSVLCIQLLYLYAFKDCHLEATSDITHSLQFEALSKPISETLVKISHMDTTGC